MLQLIWLQFLLLIAAFRRNFFSYIFQTIFIKWIIKTMESYKYYKMQAIFQCVIYKMQLDKLNYITLNQINKFFFFVVSVSKVYYFIQQS